MENWDYEKLTNKKLNEIKKDIKSKLLPKEWNTVKESGKDAYDYFNTFDLKSDKLFKGHNTANASIGGFENRTNLANVFYTATEQGRNPLTTLYSSAFAHGLNIREFNNEIDVMNKAKELKEKFNNKDYPNITYIGDLTKLTDNKIFNALMVSKYSNSINFNSQKEMNEYIENEKEKNEIFGLVSYKGHHQFFKIYNFEHFENTINKNIINTEEQSEEVLANVKMQALTKKELKEFFNNNQKDNLPPCKFMNYSFPTEEEIVAINSNQLNKILESINTESKTIENNNRESLYKEKILQILNSSNHTLKLK